MSVFDSLFDPPESAADRAVWLGGLAEDVRGAGSKNDVLDFIDGALRVPPPDGDPGALESLARLYRSQTGYVAGVFEQVDQVSRKGLPEVWVGDTSVLASAAVAAAGRSAAQLGEAFQGCVVTLLTLADAIDDAQVKDRRGRSRLAEQKHALGGRDGFFDNLHENDGEEAERKAAADVSSQAIGLMSDAAAEVAEASRVAARELNKWTAEARAGKLETGQLTPVDKLVLADTGVGGVETELNEVLSADDLTRASAHMDRLKPGDRAEMERMLAQSSSPQERAYLMKTLAAGHTVAEIREFRKKIHGKSPDWLREHLSPVVSDRAGMKDKGQAPNGSNINKTPVRFDGQDWAQGGDGSEGTCVASSTVMARATVDPVYALELTGGPTGQENDPDAFRERLVSEQHRLHEEGGGGDNWNGMDAEGREEITDSTVGSATGDDYERRELDSTAERRAVLTEIEKSVAEGKPVPVGGDGHAMTIIAQEGDKLQVFNPWGTTTWISEDDFVNGRMSKASDERFPDANLVLLPR
ncbi:peptidoglycan-binding protein [Streptomyces smaragdinus]|uniref:peptidoglycan-binding protein n=1 Tax=Streptomyces smaragdinus TaxID=2585196 RepID=UPI001E566BC4|nr:peptidoglycan-binding protein [Streptomyces smaragdinus]